MAIDINQTEFDEGTKLKLEIFRDCFKEWLPVFIHYKYTDQVFIFDFFAGSGKDKLDRPGSPLILLEEAKGENMQFCSKVKKPVYFVFNEFIESKHEALKRNISHHITSCENNNCKNSCIYKFRHNQSDFRSFFESEKVLRVLNNNKIGKFLLLDQYGFKEVDNAIFHQLIDFPKTDFIFFITSSFIKRFKSEEAVKKYFATENIDFNNKSPQECHRIIADYFRSLVPKGKDYYLHHFSIQKEKKGNYYGLIFGSNHSLGMEKFVKVCWQKDTFSGESNHNVDNDFTEGELFYTKETSNKKERVKELLKQKILNSEISDNLTGLKKTLKMGCEPKLFTLVVKELEKNKKIKREGQVNYTSVSIHKAKQYFIKLL